MHETDLLILGTGTAGYTLAREYRRLNASRRICLVSEDGAEAYPKPMLSNAYAKGKTPDTLATASAEKQAQALGATIWSHTAVTAIDPNAQRVETSAGTIAYQQCVLAVGAQPRVLSLAGDAGNTVLSVNSLDAYRQFHAQVDAASHIAIVGPGLIGCEFANDLRHAGKTVTVIGPSLMPLAGLLPTQMASALQQCLAEKGVVWRLGVEAQALQHAGSRLLLQCSQGERIETDLLLSAIGLQPRITLAQQAGIHVNRGIVTDGLLQTSMPNVYALGDCAEVCGLNLPYIAPLLAGAKALAQTLSGTPTIVRYPAMPVQIKAPDFPCVVCPATHSEAVEWHIDSQAGAYDFRMFALDTAGQRVGFACSGTFVAEKNQWSALMPDWLQG